MDKLAKDGTLQKHKLPGRQRAAGFLESDVIALHEWMTAEFAKRGITITKFYYCPHHADGVVSEYRKACDCRKPKPGLVLDAVKDFDFDIGSSLLIGDKPSDRIALEGLRCIILKSRYTDENYDISELSRAIDYLK